MAANAPAIALANYDFRASGTVAVTLKVADALHAAGLPVEVWAVRGQGPLRERVPPSVPVVIASGSAPLFRRRRADTYSQLPFIARTIRRRQPTVFLSGGNHLHLAARLALGLSGQRGRIAFGGRASNSSQRSRVEGRPNRFEQAKYGGMDFIIAVSHAIADELVPAVGEGKRVEVIANGVDADRVGRLAEEAIDFAVPDGDEPLIVAMGRLSRQKGFDLLLRALPMVPSARLVIIGTGPANERQALDALAAEQGVADRVIFAGYQPNPFPIITHADLFVSASRWEGASNALLEALACGLPLVATDCPTGNREILRDGLHGTLAPVEDPAGLAQAIRTELAIGRSRVGQREAARTHFSEARMLSRYVELLGAEHERMLASRG